MRHRSTMACDTDVAVVTDDIAGDIYAYGVRWVYVSLISTLTFWYKTNGK